MNTINKFLIAIIVILVAVIGYEGYIIYSESYAISNIKPYTDPYKSYSKDKLETMMEKGDLDATAEYGIRLIDEDNDKDGGFKLCMKAATTGNARGENAVGCYYNDMKDYNEALKWFNKAAEKTVYMPYRISDLVMLSGKV